MGAFSLKSVFLDKHYRSIFEQFLIQSGQITKRIYDEKDQTIEQLQVLKEPLTGIKKLLVILTLFENVDSSSSIYDFSKLIDIGIVPERNSISVHREDPDIYNEYYINAASDLMKLFKRDVIRWVKVSEWNLIDSLRKYAESKEFWERVDKKRRTFACSDSQGNILTLSDDYDRIVDTADKLFPLSHAYDLSDEERFLIDLWYNHDPALDIGSIRDNLVEGLYYSENKKIPFASAIFSNGFAFSKIDAIETVYYTVKTYLPNEVNILPMPQSFEDVKKMRKSPYIRSFRAVMDEWSDYIEHGEFELAEKVKKDVIKANKQLERLEKFKKCISSPYTATINLIGGLVPNLSYILGPIAFANPYIHKFLHEKYGWTLLTKE